ncbi:transporter [Chachezhania antarctica]|uniref:transporter n=1 Tax=Chachezhania antarctica TaxID=2340860 RepID=UPI001969543A|nr:transporter [Chachezhania antarctica]|tara:strand:+ start:2772 stop:3539 length:768 start_codon:yes stop_codon:yes gene_type:complete
MASGIVCALPAVARADTDLAKQLQNPVASLISVPFQLNYDQGIGASGDGNKYTMNLQPVVPISLSPSLNLISRTIIPLAVQNDVTPGTTQSGVGDVLQSFFFSPKEPTAGGLIWGVGPAFLLPSNQTGLSADQFAAGVTGVALKQSGPWTYGILANQLWDVGGGAGATEINATYVQPFLSYTTAKSVSFTLNSESTFDHVAGTQQVPVNFMVSKVTKIGSQPVSIGGGARYYADSTPNGPDGWGARFIVTFLYPK